MRKQHTAILLLAVLLPLLVAGSAPTNACTIFTIAQGDVVLFGNNEDWHSSDPVVGFRSSQEGRYGSVHVGFRHSDGHVEFAGAMNDQGLAWDVNSIPLADLVPHPERPFSHETDNYLSTITQQAATVAEAMRIADDFDFGEAIAIQIHIADATGDAAVLGPGPDGEMVFTCKPEGDGYLVSTNFNLADADEDSAGWRYKTAVSMLAGIGPSDPLTAEYARNTLDAVHLNMLTTYTLYSNVFDLRAQRVYLNYMSQYDETVEMDLCSELANGERVIEMRDLFESGTASDGDEAYQRFETRFMAAKIGLIAAIALIAVGIATFLVMAGSRS